MRQPFLPSGFLFALAACSGSSTAPPALKPPAGMQPTPAPTMTASAQTGTARITITIPLAGTTARRFKPQSYITAKTQSVGVFVTAVNGVPPSPAISATANVGGTSPGCTAGSGGITCTLAFTVPSGSDTLSVRTYAQPNGSGIPLSIGSATVAVVAGQTLDVPVTLLPVVQIVVSTFSPASLPIATAGTFTLNLTAKDAAGDVIGGTDPYYLPILVTTKDTSGHVTATPALPASITAPGQSITFAYDGKGSAASYLFTVAAQSDAIVTTVAAPSAGAFSFVGGQHLYVSSQSANAVYVYDIASDGSLSGPSRTLAGSATTLAAPTSIAVDKLGTLYVVNYHRDVTVYPPGAGGNVAPSASFGAGANPETVANNGLTGIAMAGPKTYPNGASETFFLVDIYPNGAPPGAAMNPTIPFILEGANLFAASPFLDQSGSGSLYACFAGAPAHDNGFVECTDGAIGTMSSDGGVHTYPTNNFFRFPEAPGAIGFRPDGLLTVVADPIYMRGPQINTYTLPAPQTIGSTYLTPTYSIAGSSTGLMYPTAVAFDKLGNIYVDDYGQASGNGTVKQWPINSTGNVAPTRKIAGLDLNFGIAVGP